MSTEPKERPEDAAPDAEQMGNLDIAIALAEDRERWLKAPSGVVMSLRTARALRDGLRARVAPDGGMDAAAESQATGAAQGASALVGSHSAPDGASPEGGKVAATPASTEAKRDAGVTVPPGDRQQSLASGLIPANNRAPDGAGEPWGYAAVTVVGGHELFRRRDVAESFVAKGMRGLKVGAPLIPLYLHGAPPVADAKVVEAFTRHLDERAKPVLIATQAVVNRARDLARLSEAPHSPDEHTETVGRVIGAVRELERQEAAARSGPKFADAKLGEGERVGYAGQPLRERGGVRSALVADAKEAG